MVAQAAPGMTKKARPSSSIRPGPAKKKKTAPQPKANKGSNDLGSVSKADLKKKRMLAKIGKPKLVVAPIDGIEITPEPAEAWSGGKFRLEYRGLAADALDDADGRDEVAVYVAVLTANAVSYDREVFWVTGDTLMPVDGRGVAKTGARRMFEDKHEPVLVLSAVLEDDDGSAAQGLEQVDLLVNQAILAAAKLRSDDEDPIDTLHAMIELGKISLGTTTTAPSVQTRKIDTWSWDRIIDQNAAMRSRVKYRVLIAHAVGKARYKLLFDVPQPSQHKPRRLVKVDVRELRLTTPAKLVGNKGSDISVCIGAFVNTHGGKQCAELAKTTKLSHASEWKPQVFYRFTRQEHRHVNVAVRQWSKRSGGMRLLDLNPEAVAAVASHPIDVRDSPVHIDVTYQGEDPHHGGRVRYVVDY